MALRQPLIWLDKACINQSSADNIKASLALLPIHLAGCKRLLVLIGPTYSTRLWHAAASPAPISLASSLAQQDHTTRLAQPMRFSCPYARAA